MTVCEGEVGVRVMFFSICLNQVRVIDYRRLMVRLSEVDSDVQDKIKEAFIKLYM